MFPFQPDRYSEKVRESANRPMPSYTDCTGRQPQPPSHLFGLKLFSISHLQDLAVTWLEASEGNAYSFFLLVTDQQTEGVLRRPVGRSREPAKRLAFAPSRSRSLHTDVASRLEEESR